MEFDDFLLIQLFSNNGIDVKTTFRELKERIIVSRLLFSLCPFSNSSGVQKSTVLFLFTKPRV